MKTGSTFKRTARSLAVGAAALVLVAAQAAGPAPAGQESSSSDATDRFEQGRSFGVSAVVDNGIFIPFEDHERLMASFSKYQLRPFVAKGTGGMPLLWGDLVGFASQAISSVDLPTQCPCMAEALYPQTPHEDTSELSVEGGDDGSAAARGMYAHAAASDVPDAFGMADFTDVTVAEGQISIGNGSTVSHSRYVDGFVETESVVLVKDVQVGPLQIPLMMSRALSRSNGEKDAATTKAVTRVVGAQVNDVPVAITGDGLEVADQKSGTQPVVEQQEQVNKAMAEYGAKVKIPAATTSVSDNGQEAVASTPGLYVYFFPEEHQEELQDVQPQKFGYSFSLAPAGVRSEATPGEPGAGGDTDTGSFSIGGGAPEGAVSDTGSVPGGPSDGLATSTGSGGTPSVTHGAPTGQTGQAGDAEPAVAAPTATGGQAQEAGAGEGNARPPSLGGEVARRMGDFQAGLAMLALLTLLGGTGARVAMRRII